MPTILGGDPSGGLARSPTSAVSERIFLEQALVELTNLHRAAEAYYHGVLARILASARSETQMLLHEVGQVERWPESAEQPLRKVR